MPPSIRLAAALLVLALPACTFVKMAPGAQQVKVLSVAPSGCEKRGEVAVSITHKVGFYERNPTQVRDELETLARNEAPGLGANTISPQDMPHEGSQRWAMWRCN
ncbi:DUF4156 domain-containing protein [Thermomonas paludicola]|uniref:DUF4156 domain-containing protein n=1 Tax=Thermomonas paludicola TaxID=2884874 RepID=UPI002113CE6F|nr:DUF4156 domain-containing protein [Thermomonas paludicola]